MRKPSIHLVTVAVFRAVRAGTARLTSVTDAKCLHLRAQVPAAAANLGGNGDRPGELTAESSTPNERQPLMSASDPAVDGAWPDR